MNIFKSCVIGIQDKLVDPSVAEERRVSQVKLEPIHSSVFIAEFRRMEKTSDFNYHFKAINRRQENLKYSELATLPENKKKNSTDIVIPYDHNMVELDPLANKPNSNYINASWVMGFRKQNQYIAAQGPNIKTIGDFWRMIWQHNCQCIIITTNLFEHARQQCEKYWHNSHGRYDGIDVWLDSSYSTAEFTVRNFRIEYNGECRLLRQFQFQSWSETDNTGVGTVIEVRRKMRQWMEKRQGPILVHCSTGSGRTGTFICIDNMLERIDAGHPIDIGNYVSELRACRPLMVATLDQYRFVFEVVCNYLVGGCTVIPAAGLVQRIAQLGRKSSNSKATRFEDELRNLNSFVRPLSVGECAGGHRTENRWKSRYIMVQPPERARPYLLSHENADSTDYINAVYIDGYRSNNQYIISQWPLRNTVNDLWRMVHDHHVSVIVILNDFGKGTRKYPRLWPLVRDQPTRYGPITVQLQEDYTIHQNIQCKVFLLQKRQAFSPKRNSKRRRVVVLQLVCWPKKQRVPNSPDGIIDLIRLQDEWNLKLNASASSPLLVLSSDGVCRAGMFCVISISLDRLISEGEVDIFRAVETVKRNRPQLIDNIVEYIYCYTCLMVMVDNFNKTGDPTCKFPSKPLTLFLPHDEEGDPKEDPIHDDQPDNQREESGSCLERNDLIRANREHYQDHYSAHHKSVSFDGDNASLSEDENTNW